MALPQSKAISAIVLAAGASTRMGQQKLLLDLKEKPVLQWVLEAALSSELFEVLCVVREFEPIRQKISLAHDRLRWVINPEADHGQSTSIIAGLRAISPASQGALFMVGDQPLVTDELINALVHLFEKEPPLIAALTFNGQARNPVLFHRDLFTELLALTGDRGGRSLIEKYREKAVFLEWKEEEPFLDMDVWEDYQRLIRR